MPHSQRSAHCQETTQFLQSNSVLSDRPLSSGEGRQFCGSCGRPLLSALCTPKTQPLVTVLSCTDTLQRILAGGPLRVPFWGGGPLRVPPGFALHAPRTCSPVNGGSP